MHLRILQLLSQGVPLKFVSLNLLRPLSMTKTGSKFFVVMTDRYSKLTRATPRRIKNIDRRGAHLCRKVGPAIRHPRPATNVQRPQFLKNFSMPPALHLVQYYWRTPPTTRERMVKSNGIMKLFSVILVITIVKIRTTRIHLFSHCHTLTALNCTWGRKRPRYV